MPVVEREYGTPFYWQRHGQRGGNMSEPPATTSNFVTCHCEHCGGGIEFDANQLDPAEKVVVPCPHCGLETIIFVPEEKVQPAVSLDDFHLRNAREVEREEEIRKADILAVQCNPAAQPNLETVHAQGEEVTPAFSDDGRYSDVQGSLGHFGLASWWFNAFSEPQRAYIVSHLLDHIAKTLTEGTFAPYHSRIRMAAGYYSWNSSTPGSPTMAFHLGSRLQFLLQIVNRLNPMNDYGLVVKVFQKIIQQVEGDDADVVEKYRAYGSLASHFYHTDRKFDQTAIQRTIWACIKQIEICPKVVKLICFKTPLTTEDKKRLMREALQSNKSFPEICRERNICLTNSVANSPDEQDINTIPTGYNILANLFEKEKQHGKVVALCEKVIEQGWPAAVWKEKLTLSRLYLGDEKPANEWLPELPQLKWDDALLNTQPSIPAPLEMQPQSDVPIYNLDFTNGVPQTMSPAQKAFYCKLVDSIENKTYLPVDGQMDYIGYYVRAKYKTFDKDNLERLYEELLCLAVPYSNESAFWRPKSWSFDCLLALESYDKYFEATKPVNIFSINTQLANQRCNVRYFLGMPASGIDLLQIYGGHRKPITNFTKQHPKEYEKILEAVFAEEEKRAGSWFEHILAERFLKVSQDHLFLCFHFARDSKIPNYCFYGASENLTMRICDAFREAENRLRDLLGEKRVGEQWDEETKLFHAIKKMFPDLQVIHHGKPDWLGRMHFDIWIPELKIAIEYHGQQHFEEMKHFGGAESLEATQKRDALKRSACTREGVQLFEVTSPDDAQKAIGEIRRAASLKKDKQLAFPTL